MVIMLLVAIGLLVFPVLKVRQTTTIAYKESNLKINDEKIKELDLDLSEGRIDQVFYKVAREELDRELLIDIPAESKETASLHYTGTAKRHPALALMITIFIPMLAMFVYLDLGMHSASDEEFVSAQQQAAPSSAPASIEQMAAKLEEKIEKDGGTVQEWIMLGRAHKFLGDNTQAANAFAVALEKDSNNSQLMLERAEVLALSNDRKFNDESKALIDRAYELEPENPNALWFSGVAEYQNKSYSLAIDRLTKLLPLARGEEDVVKSIISIVAKSRQSLIDAGEKMPELAEMLGIEALSEVLKAEVATQAVTKAATQAVKVSATANTVVLTIEVDVSELVKQKFDASDVVFVYAKAQQGPRMPLAAQRLTLGSLPATVILDDSMAMVEGMNLSAFEQLQVSARVTKTGSAIAQSGDYIGQINLEPKFKATTLNIVIDTLVP